MSSPESRCDSYPGPAMIAIAVTVTNRARPQVHLFGSQRAPYLHLPDSGQPHRRTFAIRLTLISTPRNTDVSPTQSTSSAALWLKNRLGTTPSGALSNHRWR